VSGETNNINGRNDRSSDRGGARRLLAASMTVLCLVAVLLLAVRSKGEPSGAGVRPSPLRASMLVTSPQDGGFTRFSHANPRHASLACDACHRRENNSAQSTLPGHKACTDCHAQQFFTPNHPMCSICHTSLEGSNPPVKGFPRLGSFNVKFDHAQHMSGAARPQGSCSSCHAPLRRGVALSIPAGISAHSNCYQCHTPGSQSGGRNISSCGACHNLGRYARTPTTARAYSVSFSHADHGPRQQLRCDQCHNVRGGLAQMRQVSSPQPSQHFASARAQSCMTCHNNKRSFGGDDFGDCKRCHTSPTTFRF
jgi:c(7)-type cytochrome triheme protein